MIRTAKPAIKQRCILRANARLHYTLRIKAGRENWAKALAQVQKFAKERFSNGFRIVINVRERNNELKGELHILGGEPLNASLKRYVRAISEPSPVRDMPIKDCFFCKAIEGKSPIKESAEFSTKSIFAFDPGPAFRQAELHYVLMPRNHHSSGNHWREVTDVKGLDFWRDFYEVLRNIKQSNPDFKAFRVICNSGPDSGQTIPHLHLQVMATRTRFASPINLDFRSVRWQELIKSWDLLPIPSR